jgi:hypothetical protein
MSSFLCTLRQFVEPDERIGAELCRSGRRDEREGIRRRRDVGFKVLDAKSVLRCVVQGLAGDHQFARDGPFTHLHPELPVRIEIAESEVLALQAIDDATADMLGFLDPGNEDVIGIRQEKVCARQRDTMAQPQGFD